ncbi:chromate efflux transporter [Poseidonocella sedimentorum]|uniref:Chromate transporter n=1 Tax=Poseidonocella sedimentorum TaxID=871652 RepID=A0A1I6DHD8_9RHOB|nr:chromate efflux transporter [Poseidonocella sedimentorum]SFR04853.1 chromate transporter [Poseidonocella sedimentorum]
MTKARDGEPGLGDLARVFGRIGVLSFGGPAAQIALMHRELVARRPWLGEADFLRALGFCMLLPGPEAMQLATYAGWRLRGVAGGLIAGGLFVLPGAAVIAVLALGYAAYGAAPGVQAAFMGIKCAVIVIVLQALVRLGRKALRSGADRALAACSFLAIFALGLPFPLILAGAALAGAVLFRNAPPAEPPAPSRHGPSMRSSLHTLLIWGGLWALPFAALLLWPAPYLWDVAVFFSKLSIITFGGAYAVLAYMTQSLVETHGWITASQMIDALGLAETTPGPLILVTQFVAMIGAGGTGQAILAGATALWVTFVPCFLWIFLAAPYVGWLTSAPALAGALRAITAAVAGVILNLALWFSMAILFEATRALRLGPLSIALPDLARPDPAALALTALAAALLLGARLPLGGALMLMAAASFGLSAL